MIVNITTYPLRRASRQQAGWENIFAAPRRRADATDKQNIIGKMLIIKNYRLVVGLLAKFSQPACCRLARRRA